MKKSILFISLFIQSSAFSNSPIDTKVIYGPDNRQDFYEIERSELRRLADSTIALIPEKNLIPLRNGWTRIVGENYGKSNKLCSNEKFFEQDSSAECSGVLVSPNIILTAGHCIKDEDACKLVRFVFNYSLKAKHDNASTVRSSDVYECEKILYRKNNTPSPDFALIQLNKMVRGHDPVRWRSSGSLDVYDSIFLIGYPAGLPLKFASGAWVRKIKKRSFVANLDAVFGNSGSPVYNEKTKLLEGILVSGEKDFERKKGEKCYSSKRCSESYCSGESVVKMSEILPHLPTN